MAGLRGHRQPIRVARLLRRRAVDGRVPPVVSELVRDQARLAPRVLLGRDAPGPAAADVVESAHDLMHAHAEAVVAELIEHGLHPFLVEERGHHLTFGLPLDERAAALQVVGGSRRLKGWRLRAVRGRRSLRFVIGAGSGRALRRCAAWATHWELWAPSRHPVGVQLGDEQAVVVTFWELTDRWEEVGRRGLHRFEPSAQDTTEEIDGRHYPGKTAFPVRTAISRPPDDVDIVFTWVDGNDPEWQRQGAAWAARQGSLREESVDDSRFASSDEIRYALRGVAAYAGWARRIFLVTAGQRPDWLVEDDRLTVIDHDEIFPADWLPTFNSHAIESRLHHVPGLAEHFVYCNDDVFLGRPLGRDAFFTGGGLPRVPVGAARVAGTDKATELFHRAAVQSAEVVADHYGCDVEFTLAHAPFPLRRSLLAGLEEEFAEQFERTGRSRFRSVDDLAVPSLLAPKVALATGEAVEGDLAAEYVHLEGRRLHWHLRRLLWGREFDTFCINATTTVQRDPATARRDVVDFLEQYYPHRSPWEKDATARG